ncbi:MAG: hypothetical protein IJH34_16420, partial [Romboutsia sp.]|nr:hypothetical protein [Romboutsia sp.]
FYNNAGIVMENGSDRASNEKFTDDDPQNGAAEAKAAMMAAIEVAVGAISAAVQGAIGKIGCCLPLGTGNQTEDKTEIQNQNVKAEKSKLLERSFWEKAWDFITFSQPASVKEREDVSDNTDSTSSNSSCFDTIADNKSSDDANVETFNPVGIYKEGQRVKNKDYDGNWCYGTVERDNSAIRPGICPKYKFVPDEGTSYGYEKYVKETHDRIVEKNSGISESSISLNIAKVAPWEYKGRALGDYISNYNVFSQIGVMLGTLFENSAITNGIDSESAHAYGQLYGDYSAGLYFEGILTTGGSALKYANALRNGEEVSKESIIAGSGIGNLGGESHRINPSKLSDVWKLGATERGEVIEEILASTEYKEWYNIGASQGGYFPVIDFQKGKSVVSMKTIDPQLPSMSGSGATNKVIDYLNDLDKAIKVDDNAANRILDVRIPEGTKNSFDLDYLIKESEKKNIKLIIKEFK